MVCQYVYQTYEVDADALAMATTPLDELLRSAEARARPSSSSSIAAATPTGSNADAQRARQNAEAAYKALPRGAPPARKLQALKEWLIVCLRESTPSSPTSCSRSVCSTRMLHHADATRRSSLFRHRAATRPRASAQTASRRDAEEGGQLVHTRHDDARYKTSRLRPITSMSAPSRSRWTRTLVPSCSRRLARDAMCAPITPHNSAVAFLLTPPRIETLVFSDLFHPQTIRRAASLHRNGRRS